MKETDVIRQFARTPEHDDKQYISTLLMLVVRLANEIDKLQDQIDKIAKKVNLTGLEKFGYASVIKSEEELSGYNQPLTNYGDLIPLDKFKEFCKHGMFIDYDGHGHPVKDNKMSGHYIKPSKLDQIPEDATHIMWYNK